MSLMHLITSHSHHSPSTTTKVRPHRPRLVFSQMSQHLISRGKITTRPNVTMNLCDRPTNSIVITSSVQQTSPIITSL